MRDFQFAFILGNPRSGTSLFRLMLNAHNKAIAPPECGFMQWWYEKYFNWEIKDNFSNRLNQFIEDLFSSKKIESWNLDKMDLKEFIQKQNPNNYNELTACVYLAYGNKRSVADVLIDKNNYYIKHLDLLTKIWPSAKFIHLVRDGRDVVCSYRELNKLNTKSDFKPILPEKIEDIAKEWTENNIHISQLSNTYKYTLVRYEDLLENPEFSLEKVCNFLDIDFDTQMLKYYELKEDFLIEPKETLDWKKKTQEKPDLKRIGQYYSVLNNEEVQDFERIAKQQLEEYGYK